MRNREKNRKRCLAILLGVLLFLQTGTSTLAQAAAEDGEETPVLWTMCKDLRAPESHLSVIDPDRLQALTEQALEELKLNGEKVGIGFCYTPTGETWYYNEDLWLYSASLYKVPLMMILAEREHAGELTQESLLKGSLTLAYAEERILTHSDNERAHTVINYLGSSRQEVWEMFKPYSDMAEEDYSEDFLTNSRFNPRFITSVMQTLYYEQERFPNILECLKQAKPNGWFQKTGDHEYEIAQKYGVYEQYYHDTGVIYTPNPFILTVMTVDASYAQNKIAQVKQYFQEYTLELDPRLEEAREAYAQYLEELERQEREAEEEAQRQAEEEARLAQEAAEKAAAAVMPEPAAPKEEPKPTLWPAAAAGTGLAAVLLLAVLWAMRKRRGRE